MHLCTCLPANRWLLPGPSAAPAVPAGKDANGTASGTDGPSRDDSVAAAGPAARQRRVTMLLLGFVFAASAFVAGAMATQMIRLLEAMGSTPAAAIFAGMLIGPAQVLARIVEFARGTLPLWLFGPDGYGALLGRIGGIARIAQAIAPFAFGIAVDALGGAAVAITAGLMAAAVLALLAIRRREAA
jgi:hypothetical protein